jgi:hypothetical protein
MLATCHPCQCLDCPFSVEPMYSFEALSTPSIPNTRWQHEQAGRHNYVLTTAEPRSKVICVRDFGEPTNRSGCRRLRVPSETEGGRRVAPLPKQGPGSPASGLGPRWQLRVRGAVAGDCETGSGPQPRGTGAGGYG